MRNAIIVFIILAIAAPTMAGTWCQWSGTEGINCKSDGDKGYFKLPNGIPVAEKNYNEYGYFELIITHPAVGENRIRDTEAWGFADNQITKTWTVRDMTVKEIDENMASPMSMTDYYLWKTLLATGVITQTQAANNLPPEMVDAYQARKRLLGD